MSAGILMPTWIVMLAAICVIAVFIRLTTSGRVGFALLAIGLSAAMFVGRQSHPNVIVHGHGPLVAEVETPDGVTKSPLPPHGKPVRPRRAPKSAPATRPSVGVADNTNPETPPAPPVASTTETPAVADAPIVLYQGSSKTGRAIDSLPAWVTELAEAGPGANSVAFSSDRFATVEEADKQLWTKARDFVARDLRERIPEAGHWSPSNDLLKSRGFIVERCVERTEIEVGQFVEPMYRVHWKASLSTDLRNSVVDAWRPTVQQGRLEAVGLGFLGATGLFAFLNIILRSVAARMAAKKSPA